jgi:hypothetical protein
VRRQFNRNEEASLQFAVLLVGGLFRRWGENGRLRQCAGMSPERA